MKRAHCAPIKVRAGEVVTIAASGRYSVASNGEPINTNGFLSAAFAEYGEVRRLGDEARAAPGTPETATKLAQRHDKAMHANLLIGFQEQLIILQLIFNTMMEELRAMSGTMVLHDPNGVHPLANNWGDFYTRMGIDPAGVPADPRTITPGSDVVAALARTLHPEHERLNVAERLRNLDTNVPGTNTPNN